MNPKLLALVLSAAGAMASNLAADTVTLKNGDKLTGTIGRIAAGKMSFNSPVLGDLTIDLTNVQTYTTDTPATIRLKGGAAPIHEPITSADADKVETADGKSVPVTDIKAINPSPQKWTGSIIGLGALARGNTDTFDVGVAATATLRRDSEFEDDRLTLGGAYNFGTNGKGDLTSTTTDNWNASGKFDKFWSEKFYTYGSMKVEHDRIASLYYRLTPGIGLGYQWIEQPTMNFNTEAGLAYVYEKFDQGGNSEFVALRLAYHFDKKLTDKAGLFHNLEWLPAFEDPGDYLLNTDVGVKVDLTKSLFAQFKIDYKRDSQPADNSLKDDVRYSLGVGWSF